MDFLYHPDPTNINANGYGSQGRLESVYRHADGFSAQANFPRLYGQLLNFGAGASDMQFLASSYQNELLFRSKWWVQEWTDFVSIWHSGNFSPSNYALVHSHPYRADTWLPSKNEIGLGNVDNTEDINKTVAYANNAGLLLGRSDYSLTNHSHNILYSKYTYNEGGSGMINNSTSAESLCEPSSLSVAMQDPSHDLFGTYATTLSFSGYQRYGATQISVKYNGGNGSHRMAFRNYNQVLSGWNNWCEIWNTDNFTDNHTNWDTAYNHSQSAHTYEPANGNLFQNAPFGCDANTVAGNRQAFTYAVNAPSNGALAYFGAEYGLQINANAYGENIHFRLRNGDAGNWNAWRELWHRGNFNPANYALAHGHPYLPLAGGSFDTNAYTDYSNSTWGGVLRIGGINNFGGGTAQILSTNGNLHLDPQTEREIYLGFYSGRGIVNFGNGALGVAAKMDTSGQLYKGSSVYWNADNFTPSAYALAHTHPYRTETWVPSWGEVTGKPSTFAPEAHTHGLLSSYRGSNSSSLQYWYGVNDELNPNTDYWYSLRMGRGDADTYYSAQLSFNFFTDIIKFRRRGGGSLTPWVELYHTGNLTPSKASDAGTVVLRDQVGCIYANYVYGSYFNASAGNSENPAIGQIWTQNTYDNYLRKSTPTHFRSQVIDGYYSPTSHNHTIINGIYIGTIIADGFTKEIRAAGYNLRIMSGDNNHYLGVNYGEGISYDGNTMWHAGNANRTDINWSCSSLTASNSGIFSGPVTASGFYTNGGRPIAIENGGITIQGDSGGWAMEYGFRGAADAAVGGFGAFGIANGLGNYYIGTYAIQRAQFISDGSVNLNGNTTIRGSANIDGAVTAPTFNGALNGNAASASSAGYATNAGGAFGLGYDGNAITGVGQTSTWDTRQNSQRPWALNYHTGITISAHNSYGGTRIYDAGYPNHTSSVLRMQIANRVDIYGDLVTTGSIAANGIVKTDTYFKTNSTIGLIGDYNETGTADKLIWSIGTSWATLGNMYGLGYNYEPIAGFGHSIFFANSGGKNIQFSLGSGSAWFAGSVAAGGIITAGTGQGFQNANYQAGYNRIWSFGSSSVEYGMGYYQGGGTQAGGDMIGFHFGDRNTAKFWVDLIGNVATSGNLTVNGLITNRVDGNAQTWYGRISHSNSTADKQVFLATYQNNAVVGAHNYALNAWADLYVNCVHSGGGAGGNVIMGGSLIVGGPIVCTGSGTFQGGGFNSRRGIKDIHADWDGDALGVIAQFKLRDFNYKSRPLHDRTLGFIIDEIPEEIRAYALLGTNRDAVNTYTLHGLSFKAHQETKKKVELLEEKIIVLENENISLKGMIKQLERKLT